MSLARANCIYSRAVVARDIPWDRHEGDLLFRWIRAARIVAQEEGLPEVDVQCMRQAAARLAEHLVRKREEKARPGGRPVWQPETTGFVLPGSPHATKIHAELVPPSDWLVDAVTRHEGRLRAIAKRIAYGR